MTEYHDRVAEADLLEKIDAAENLIGALSAEQVGAIEEEKGNQIKRLRTILLALRPRVEAADPLLVTGEVLKSTKGPLTSI